VGKASKSAAHSKEPEPKKIDREAFEELDGRNVTVTHTDGDDTKDTTGRVMAVIDEGMILNATNDAGVVRSVVIAFEDVTDYSIVKSPKGKPVQV
jgi:hypothetical protein